MSLGVEQPSTEKTWWFTMFYIFGQRNQGHWPRFFLLHKYGRCHITPWDTRWMPMNLWGGLILWNSHPVLSSAGLLSAILLYGWRCLWRQGPRLNLWFPNTLYLYQCWALWKWESLEQGFPGCWAMWKVTNFMRGLWVQQRLENLECSSVLDIHNDINIWRFQNILL